MRRDIKSIWRSLDTAEKSVYAICGIVTVLWAVSLAYVCISHLMKVN